MFKNLLTMVMGWILMSTIATSVSAYEPQTAEKCIRASCEIRMETVRPPYTYHGYGGGTLAELPDKYSNLLEEDEVAVVTAGHVIHDPTKDSKIRLRFFVPAKGKVEFAEQSIPARVVLHSFRKREGDVGILAVKAKDVQHLKPVPMSIQPPKIKSTDEVLLIGCPGDDVPRVDLTKAIQIGNTDGYSIMVATVRKGGQSGGGAFDSSGTLIGVCSCGSERYTETWVGPGLADADTVARLGQKVYGQTSHFSSTADLDPVIARAVVGRPQVVAKARPNQPPLVLPGEGARPEGIASKGPTAPQTTPTVNLATYLQTRPQVPEVVPASGQIPDLVLPPNPSK